MVVIWNETLVPASSAIVAGLVKVAFESTTRLKVWAADPAELEAEIPSW